MIAGAQPVVTPTEALQRLQDGNRRFVSNRRNQALIELQPSDTAEMQLPFAIVLGCSDSRVPAELVFDQGLGDLFVIRVAGNIAAPSQIGSIEYAADSFGTALVVVLGHTDCGAVNAAVGELQKPGPLQSDNLRAIVDFIRPSAEAALTEHGTAGQDALVQCAVRKNIARAVRKLRGNSALLAARVAQDQLLIVGAEYSLVTGEVEFLPDPEETPHGH